jgi:hypothetical protein
MVSSDHTAYGDNCSRANATPCAISSSQRGLANAHVRIRCERQRAATAHARHDTAPARSSVQRDNPVLFQHDQTTPAVIGRRRRAQEN